MSAAAVNNTSVEEFKAVSAESCITPMMKPMATTCMAVLVSMLNKLHANGISNKEPPATPDAPQAQTADTKHNNKAEPKSTGMFKVWAAASVKTLMVQAAPAILMVAPNGIETE